MALQARRTKSDRPETRLPTRHVLRPGQAVDVVHRGADSAGATVAIVHENGELELALRVLEPEHPTDPLLVRLWLRRSICARTEVRR
jgi:hypothetical protein